MSILRSKPYHTVQAISNTLDYVEDEEKTGVCEDNDIQNIFNYAVNPDKTMDSDKQLLISGVECKPDTAEMQFETDRDRYYDAGHKEVLAKVKSRRLVMVRADENGNPIRNKNGKYIRAEKMDKRAVPLKGKDGKCIYEDCEYQKQVRTAYMWVLSFPGKKEIGYEVSPQLAHQIGVEFCEQYLQGYRCVVSTHVNTDHVHDHIVANAYPIDPLKGKYRDSMETLMRAREIADNLSLQYGLPIIIAPGKDPDMNWYEWNQRREGSSFKAQIEKDAAAAKSVAKSFKDFKDLMEMTGYELRETEHHITYIMPSNDIRCRDSKLSGEEFTKDALIAYFGKDIVKAKATEPEMNIIQHKQLKIYVARYTDKGRRRSDLEIILLKAIKIIKALRNYYNDDDIGKKIKTLNPVVMPADWKLQQMEDTLALVQNYNYQSLDDLRKDLLDTGSKLSQAKSESSKLKDGIESKEKVLDDIETAMSCLKSLKEKGLSVDDLQIYNYKKDEIHKNKCSVNPITPTQKKDLFNALEKTPSYKITCKYDDLSCEDAKACIDFLKGKTDIKPDVLNNGSANLKLKYEKIYQTRIDSLDNKYKNVPITKAQEKKLQELFNSDNKKLASLGDFEIDTDKLSSADAIKIINYLEPNKMDSPIATGMLKDKFDMMVAQYNLKPNRAIITENDVKEVQDYVNGKCKSRNVPGILDKNAPIEWQMKQVKDLLRVRNEDTTVPIDQMSKKEVDGLYDHLLYEDKVPDIIDTADQRRTEQDNTFIQMLDSMPSPEDQETFKQARDAFIELAKLGITPDNIDTSKLEVMNEIEKYHNIEADEKVLSIKYKELSRMKYNLGLAENKMFTYGPKYKEHEAVKDDIKEVDRASDEKDKEEERAEEERKNEKKGYRSEDKYFDDISL